MHPLYISYIYNLSAIIPYQKMDDLDELFGLDEEDDYNNESVALLNEPFESTQIGVDDHDDDGK
jgi:hypothetical protein